LTGFAAIYSTFLAWFAGSLGSTASTSTQPGILVPRDVAGESGEAGRDSSRSVVLSRSRYRGSPRRFSPRRSRHSIAHGGRPVPMDFRRWNRAARIRRTRGLVRSTGVKEGSIGRQRAASRGEEHEPRTCAYEFGRWFHHRTPRPMPERPERSETVQVVDTGVVRFRNWGPPSACRPVPVGL